MSGASLLDINSDTQGTAGGANFAGASTGSNNHYNVGGFAFPEYPNFSSGGVDTRIKIGSGTSYALAGALALLALGGLAMMKKRKG